MSIPEERPGVHAAVVPGVTRRPVFGLLSGAALVLTLTQLVLYVDARDTTAHFDPMRPSTLPRLHANAIRGTWLLSVGVAVVLTVAYAGGARIRAAVLAAIAACCVGASLWTTPLRLGEIALPGVVRSGDLVAAIVLCSAAFIAFLAAYIVHRRD